MVDVEEPSIQEGVSYNWREANRALFNAHAPPPSACDNLVVALKLQANLQKEENSIEVVYGGIKESSRGRWWRR